MMSALAIQLILFGGWLPKPSKPPSSLADLDPTAEEAERVEVQLGLQFPLPS